MKLYEVIDKVRKIKQGYEISDEDIIRAVSSIESDIILNIINGREGDEEYSEFKGYGIDTDRATELIVPVPYDDIYVTKVCCEIDLRYEDSERYQIDTLIFSNLFSELRKYWFRTHRQKRKYNYFL